MLRIFGNPPADPKGELTEECFHLIRISPLHLWKCFQLRRKGVVRIAFETEIKILDLT